jgi:hypothetical protein
MNVNKARRCDVVEWKALPKSTPKRMRVVENWTKDEPPRLLVCDELLNDTRCYTVLAMDCELVEIHPINQE